MPRPIASYEPTALPPSQPLQPSPRMLLQQQSEAGLIHLSSSSSRSTAALPAKASHRPAVNIVALLRPCTPEILSAPQGLKPDPQHAKFNTWQRQELVRKQRESGALESAATGAGKKPNTSRSSSGSSSRGGGGGRRRPKEDSNAPDAVEEQQKLQRRAEMLQAIPFFPSLNLEAMERKFSRTLWQHVEGSQRRVVQYRGGSVAPRPTASSPKPPSSPEVSEVHSPSSYPPKVVGSPRSTTLISAASFLTQQSELGSPRRASPKKDKQLSSSLSLSRLPSPRHAQQPQPSQYKQRAAVFEQCTAWFTVMAPYEVQDIVQLAFRPHCPIERHRYAPVDSERPAIEELWNLMSSTDEGFREMLSYRSQDINGRCQTTQKSVRSKVWSATHGDDGVYQHIAFMRVMHGEANEFYKNTIAEVARWSNDREHHYQLKAKALDTQFPPPSPLLAPSSPTAATTTMMHGGPPYPPPPHSSSTNRGSGGSRLWSGTRNSRAMMGLDLHGTSSSSMLTPVPPMSAVPGPRSLHAAPPLYPPREGDITGAPNNVNMSSIQFVMNDMPLDGPSSPFTAEQQTASVHRNAPPNSASPRAQVDGQQPHSPSSSSHAPLSTILHRMRTTVETDVQLDHKEVRNRVQREFAEQFVLNAKKAFPSLSPHGALMLEQVERLCQRGSALTHDDLTEWVREIPTDAMFLSDVISICFSLCAGLLVPEEKWLTVLRERMQFAVSNKVLLALPDEASDVSWILKTKPAAWGPKFITWCCSNPFYQMLVQGSTQAMQDAVIGHIQKIPPHRFLEAMLPVLEAMFQQSTGSVVGQVTARSATSYTGSSLTTDSKNDGTKKMFRMTKKQCAALPLPSFVIEMLQPLRDVPPPIPR